MYVQVDIQRGLAYVEDLHDTKAFSLVVSGSNDPSAVDQVLGEAGRLDPEDDDHAWLSIGWVRAEAMAKAPPGWGERFDAMVQHAGTKGWLSPAGDALRAHVQYTGLDE